MTEVPLETFQETINRPRSRLIFIDILHIISIFGTISIHHNAVFVGKKFDSIDWKVGLILCVFYQYSVPVFALITGAMLLSYHEKYDTRTFFKKRFSRVIIPLFSWELIQLTWKVFILHTIILQWNFRFFIKMFFTSTIDFSYWYLFTVIGSYFTIPVLSPLAEKQNQNLLIYAIIIYFVLNLMLPSIIDIFKLSINLGLTLQLKSYSIYTLTGYFINSYPFSLFHRRLIYICGIGFSIFKYLYMYNECKKIKRFKWFDFPSADLLHSTTIFLFFKNLKYSYINSHPLLQSFIKKLAETSLGIYLIHMIVIYYENKFFPCILQHYIIKFLELLLHF